MLTQVSFAQKIGTRAGRHIVKSNGVNVAGGARYGKATDRRGRLAFPVSRQFRAIHKVHALTDGPTQPLLEILGALRPGTESALLDGDFLGRVLRVRYFRALVPFNAP